MRAIFPFVLLAFFYWLVGGGYGIDADCLLAFVVVVDFSGVSFRNLSFLLVGCGGWLWWRLVVADTPMKPCEGWPLPRIMSAGRFRSTGVSARYAIGDKLALPEVRLRFVPPPAQSAGAASFMPFSYHY
jgi:hypothetical protein